ncbi:MAG TPA: TetR/AcrR family transcriptional regulator [Candidatus Sumerlaeota bacterium]|mgnify:CR=1 FL=1|nr:MAG: transcriptional regulator BetI [candidate division BRC1 bacterium ADurb.BinA292]HOE96193.1 TetR/AcrR family transcriptional regulator [Candidatus Sumerlaeota bacterium]HPK03603.1 TetR/AcrR family transcriptional regulator [Candidatus Sumerlaeota bacterium]
MPRVSCRESILAAAETVVIEAGAAHLTLEAVAERAGLSKGGLIYHFPTKESLLEAMVARMAERFEQERERVRRQLGDRNASDLVVEILTLQGYSRDHHRLSAALLAVVANKPELIGGTRAELRKRFHRRLTSRGDFNPCAVLFFAALGLHFHDLLNLSLLSRKQRGELYRHLVNEARKEVESP